MTTLFDTPTLVLQDAPDTALTAFGFDYPPTGHCPRCAQDVPLKLSRSGIHVRGDCSTCGGYVRFVEQPGILPFGKYRGRPIREVPHDYLAWLRRTPEVWDRLSEARQRAVEEALRAVHQVKVSMDGEVVG